MNIFISGSSSILASAVIEACFEKNKTMFIQDILPADAKDIPAAITRTTAGKTMDVVMILSGEQLFDGYLNKNEFASTPSAQVKQVSALCQYFADLNEKPATLLLASSTRIYARDTLQPAGENGRLGDHYLANYFKKIENATKPAEQKGIRVLHLRLGKVLSRQVEPSLHFLPIFHGSVPLFWQDDKRRISWVSQEDAVRAIDFLLENRKITTPVNITSPSSIPKDTFHRELASQFGRKLTPALPKKLIDISLNAERASLYFADSDCQPVKLSRAGFAFHDLTLQEYFHNPAWSESTTTARNTTAINV